MKRLLAVLVAFCVVVAFSAAAGASRPPRLYRTEGKDAILGGVAGGIAEYFGIDPTIVRVIWAAAALSGVGIVAYVLFWFIAPAKSEVIGIQNASMGAQATWMRPLVAWMGPQTASVG